MIVMMKILTITKSVLNVELEDTPIAQVAQRMTPLGTKDDGPWYLLKLKKMIDVQNIGSRKLQHGRLTLQLIKYFAGGSKRARKSYTYSHPSGIVFLDLWQKHDEKFGGKMETVNGGRDYYYWLPDLDNEPTDRQIGNLCRQFLKYVLTNPHE